MDKNKLIKILEDRLQDYRARYVENRELHLDIRASEVEALLKIVIEEN